MIAIECDNPEIEKALRTMETQIREAGGYFHDSVGFRSEGGALSVFSPRKQAAGETLIALPAACLLPLKKVKTALSGDDIVIESHDKDLPKHKVALFDSMLTIYNLSKKMPFHCATAPWIAFANDPETLKWFANARPDSSYAKEIRTQGSFSDLDKIALETFLHTRYLNFQGPNPVLMPFFDYANHHAGAIGFASQNEQLKGPGIALLNSKPVEDTDEVFVQYQLFDSLDMFIIYGYVEKTTPFVRSVPVIIKLHGLGTISVRAFQGAPKKGKLPSKMADLRPYLPKVLERKGDVLRISHLNIPNPEARHALRRVLRGFVKALKPELTPNQVKGYVQEAEFHVITRNIKFYKNLTRHLGQKKRENPDNPAYDAAIELVLTQLKKLSGYRMLEQGRSIQKLLG